MLLRRRVGSEQRCMDFAMTPQERLLGEVRVASDQGVMFSTRGSPPRHAKESAELRLRTFLTALLPSDFRAHIRLELC